MKKKSPSCFLSQEEGNDKLRFFPISLRQHLAIEVVACLGGHGHIFLRHYTHPCAVDGVREDDVVGTEVRLCGGDEGVALRDALALRAERKITRTIAHIDDVVVGGNLVKTWLLVALLPILHEKNVLRIDEGETEYPEVLDGRIVVDLAPAVADVEDGNAPPRDFVQKIHCTQHRLETRFADRRAPPEGVIAPVSRCRSLGERAYCP